LTVRCREIRIDDIEHVVDLLARGFTDDRRFQDHGARARYWVNAIKRLGMHPTPPELPRYGYCLDTGERLVGVVLLSFAAINGSLRCNVSSWYVDPGFRIYAAILARRATKNKDAIFFNLSPAPNTWEILERQGFMSYAHGRFIAVPALSRAPPGARTLPYAPDVRSGPDLSQSEIDMLRDHAALGCMSLICTDGEARHPFVFDLRVRGRTLPIVRLIYCRNVDSFVRFAGALGRYLLRRGYPFVVTDAEGPVAGLVGGYKQGSQRYWKGPSAMRLGDMAYSEIVMFDYNKITGNEHDDNPTVSNLPLITKMLAAGAP
jgi:hypothetical protein